MVTYGTVAEVSHAGVSQQLSKHARSRFLPRLQHLHCLITEEEEGVTSSTDAVFIVIIKMNNQYITGCSTEAATLTTVKWWRCSGPSE